MVKRTTCPRCGQCPFVDGVCEEKVSRGRRFFLLGALALPVAAQIARVAKLVPPVLPPMTIEYRDHVWVWSGAIKIGDLLSIRESRSHDGQYYVTRAEQFRYAIEKG